MKTLFITGMFLIIQLVLCAQNQPVSIHYEQQQFYNQFGEKYASFYDSLSGFSGKLSLPDRSDCQLDRIVFGFHPYWAGSDYLNYQWDLISDFCYFSYEVDPYTGGPVNYHEWLTDPAIDSAKAHGVKVHLCATLFSAHNSFFTNMASRRNLLDSLISLLLQRNADGINMDIEAVPAYLRDSLTVFMHDLSVQLKAMMPGAQISIDLPAVDWGNSFDIDALDPYIDFFFIMGYDYYLNGSAEAGPVSPLYSMTSGYDYSLARTVSSFESTGVRPEKLILGIPYYGRQWKTQSNTIPSQVLANGTALTYSSIRVNNGTYNQSDYNWEPNSISSCYIFFQNGNWNQCFIGLDRDLRKRYDMVNYRKLAGIGIWALGYDDGYPELWQAISDKFTNCYIPLSFDTLYDSGGPSWNYYMNEDYTLTIDHGFNDMRWLTFTGISLEEGYDSLWVYAGSDTTFPVLGAFSGSFIPGNFSSPNGAFTLRFKSDPLQNSSGWTAIYHDGSIGIEENPEATDNSLWVYPNPADRYVNIDLPAGGYEKLIISDITGRVIFKREQGNIEPGKGLIHLSISTWPGGLYNIVIMNNLGQMRSSRFVKLNR